MTLSFSIQDGEYLVKIARKVVEHALKGEEYDPPEDFKERFSEKSGVFTTIKTFPEKKLRGCIGFPYPIYPLWKALILSSYSAAFEDPRFNPLKPEEIDRVIFEITVLTPPKKITVKDPSEYLEKIKIGRDGILIKRGLLSGLLLPQVPVEEGWDVVEFLNYGCLKAGLPPGCWQDRLTEVYTFQGIIFEEKEPKGEVIKVEQ